MGATNENYSARIERVFDAPRERVFDAWTDPDQIRLWWTHGNVEVVRVEGCVQVGETLVVEMLDHENGERYVSETTYTKIEAPSRLVWTVTFNWARDELTRVTVTFDEVSAGTKVMLVHEWFKNDEYRDGVETGWNASLDALAALLAVKT